MTARTLPAFSPKQLERAETLLAGRVTSMNGRKLEEDDWSSVYCEAKGIPLQGWSNLNIDVVHGPLGVEHKMLRYDQRLDLAFGTTHMHPSLTRSIRIPSIDADAEEVKEDVFAQYAELVESRREYVAQQNNEGGAVDLRTGWLLWQTSLQQFLYFEEETTAPNPADYRAEWNERSTGGRRKPSKNLWIFERSTQKKRYSVTTSAGIKIQPYFDVPPHSDPNVYLFTVQGAPMPGGSVRATVTRRTAEALKQVLGSLDSDTLSTAVLRAADILRETEFLDEAVAPSDDIQFLTLKAEAYAALGEVLPGVNDEDQFQQLAHLLPLE
jgi:hypothetical protein